MNDYEWTKLIEVQKKREDKVEAVVLNALDTASTSSEAMMAEIADIDAEYIENMFKYVRPTTLENDEPHQQQTLLPEHRPALLRRARCTRLCRHALIGCAKLCSDGRASAVTSLMASFVALPPPIQKHSISWFRATPPSTIYDDHHRPIVPGIYVCTRCHSCCLETTVLVLYPGLNVANYDDVTHWCDDGHSGYCRYNSHRQLDRATFLEERAEHLQIQYKGMARLGNLAEASLLQDDWYRVEDLIDYAMNRRIRKFKARLYTADAAGDTMIGIEISPGAYHGNTFRLEARPHGNGGYHLVEKRIGDEFDRIFRLVAPF
jgi:hypothetical protein